MAGANISPCVFWRAIRTSAELGMRWWNEDFVASEVVVEVLLYFVHSGFLLMGRHQIRLWAIIIHNPAELLRRLPSSIILYGTVFHQALGPCILSAFDISFELFEEGRLILHHTLSALDISLRCMQILPGIDVLLREFDHRSRNRFLAGAYAFPYWATRVHSVMEIWWLIIDWLSCRPYFRSWDVGHAVSGRTGFLWHTLRERFDFQNTIVCVPVHFRRQGARISLIKICCR